MTATSMAVTAVLMVRQPTCSWKLGLGMLGILDALGMVIFLLKNTHTW